METKARDINWFFNKLFSVFFKVLPFLGLLILSLYVAVLSNFPRERPLIDVGDCLMNKSGELTCGQMLMYDPRSYALHINISFWFVVISAIYFALKLLNAKTKGRTAGRRS